MRFFRSVLIAVLMYIFVFSGIPAFAQTVTCWFPPGWANKKAQARQITSTLTKKTGLFIKPRVAKSYPFIVASFNGKEEALVYVGSFVQAIIKARGLGVPLVQADNGKKRYGAWMILPAKADPDDILKNQPEKIAYAMGASSGESGAKAATKGAAKIATANHGATVKAIMDGKAAAGFVKSWWWRANKDKYPTLKAHQITGISDEKNPDNVLTASKGLSAEIRDKVKQAAIESADVFGAKKMVDFNPDDINFSLGLMKMGKIDPKTYSW